LLAGAQNLSCPQAQGTLAKPMAIACFSVADSATLLLVRGLSPGFFALFTGFANIAVACMLLLPRLAKTFSFQLRVGQ